MTKFTALQILSKLTDDQMHQLMIYANNRHRAWKSQLGSDWMDGRCSSELQEIRNSHGPSWLSHITYADLEREHETRFGK